MISQSCGVSVQNWDSEEEGREREEEGGREGGREGGGREEGGRKERGREEGGRGKEGGGREEGEGGGSREGGGREVGEKRGRGKEGEEGEEESKSTWTELVSMYMYAYLGPQASFVYVYTHQDPAHTNIHQHCSSCQTTVFTTQNSHAHTL